MAQHNELGKIGEKKAIEYLLRKEYEILDTNWRHLKGEIDIIAKKENTLAIIEVKTRTSIDIVAPEEAVNEKKKQLLIATANQYVIEKDIDADVRFDIISIHKQKNKFEIKHIDDAFYFF